jgi:hypothetical protein
MVEHDGNTVRAVAWSEVFPWLSLVRVFRVSIAVRALVLGAIAILITATGWGLVGMIFGADSPATLWLHPYAACSWKAVTDAVPDRPLLPYAADTSGRWIDPRTADSTPYNPVGRTWALLSQPAVVGLTQTDRSVRDAASLLLCGLWGVAVWAFFGAAICRMAAVQLAANEQVGLGSAFRYAVKKWPSYFAAPLFPIGGVLLATIPVLVLGLVMRANIGLLLGGLLWPLVLVAGLLMTLLLLGVLFGWPLMWATISAEGTDSFDALSRSYAYTFQRPLHYLFYAVVAGFIGWLGWLLVQNFAAGVIWMGYWAAGWGSGSAPINAIMGVGEELSGIGYVGAVLIRSWAECVKLLAVGYLFSYFWTASTAIYFLLRRDVDATEMDEVFLDADAGEQTFGLPAVGADACGAPVAEDDAAENEPTGTSDQG